MGMYDYLVFPCFFCKKETCSQTKIFGDLMTNWKIGDILVMEEEETDFFNCILKCKDSCEFCKKETAIVIKDGKFVGVEDPKYSTIIEGHWGQYEIVDELESLIKEKLRKNEK